jgi:hypothetical protein
MSGRPSRTRNHAMAVSCVLLWACLASAQSFETRVSTPTVGGDTAGLATGDFNGDGKLDVAIADIDLQVFLGNGDGTFGAPVNYLAGLGTFFVVAADLNGDHKLDLVAADFSGVSVLLGNGDGSFQAPATLFTPCTPNFVAAGDLNGDHKLDLVVTYGSTSCSYVSVFLGNGDGTFQPTPINTTPLYAPGATGIGDFNRDGRLDLAVTEQFTTLSQVEVLLGNGDGTFSAGNVYATGGFPTSVAVADFRGNGNLDIAVATLYGGTDVFLGNGDGTFVPAGGAATPDSLLVIVADLNGDGKPDLAVVSQARPAGVNVALGNGDGTFQPVTFYPVGNSDRSVAAGDFNGDKETDLLVGDTYPADLYTVLNTGVVSFHPTNGINYPFQLVGAVSPAQTVTLTNTGTQALSISSIKLASPFHQTNNCGRSVAAGAKCAISIYFKPQTAGSVTGLLTILDSASSKPQVVEATGAGTVVRLSPAKLTFAAQVGTTSPPQQIQITNTGSTALTFNYSLYIGGINPNYFSETNNCGSQLAAGASCTSSVTFSPKKTGSFSASLGMNDNGGGSPQTVPLTGTGD